uniref:PH domain-containing protein n=1 Tax=Chromera velia CCMP2878 TaxID=1169474 RepID=A0A0G4FN02_9ALVE|mmetsp:Transcript_47561/g.93858  ORF Transcript_47561/g.93858 Transcript_47561/m.93858 type:complete len:448 (-) Transcript_47561:669-2012(-)|eukprot:Cvel_17668.t1-p1 / transcript=Cvel_17668.t1 / gene=Cvel_17668 / organism=Chromera_velia_CCMP2878 / gene_product=hypothetical protein / transcript_product=hypothetical protein / location=Cvel_scaffold1424:11017-12357(+) / protein_length=447 / sequence_SO=supercontig / SO=protein_coding / is_pseudo=false
MQRETSSHPLLFVRSSYDEWGDRRVGAAAASQSASSRDGPKSASRLQKIRELLYIPVSDVIAASWCSVGTIHSTASQYGPEEYLPCLYTCFGLPKGTRRWFVLTTQSVWSFVKPPSWWASRLDSSSPLCVTGRLWFPSKICDLTSPPVPHDSDRRAIKFVDEAGRRTIVLRLDSEEERAGWLNLLQSVVFQRLHPGRTRRKVEEALLNASPSLVPQSASSDSPPPPPPHTVGERRGNEFPSHHAAQTAADQEDDIATQHSEQEAASAVNRSANISSGEASLPIEQHRSRSRRHVPRWTREGEGEGERVQLLGDSSTVEGEREADREGQRRRERTLSSSSSAILRRFRADSRGGDDGSFVFEAVDSGPVFHRENPRGQQGERTVEEGEENERPRVVVMGGEMFDLLVQRSLLQTDGLLLTVNAARVMLGWRFEGWQSVRVVGEVARAA